MHYVIEMRDTSMRAIGPFASQDAAAEWGANHNPDDDPRWQTIELDVEDGDDLIVMPIVAPARAELGAPRFDQLSVSTKGAGSVKAARSIS